MTFRFHFDVKKAIQSIGVLMRHDQVTQMNLMRILKLLYLAERDVLQQTGRSITGDSFAALERGPVMENIYSLIRDQHSEFSMFDEYFQRERYSLKKIKDPEIDELSEFEIDAIQRTATEHAERDEWALVQFTHELVEWKKNDPGKSSKMIPVADVLEAVGYTPREIEEVMAEEIRRRSASPRFPQPAAVR
jgi:uncharacterized phage-associated protein